MTSPPNAAPPGQAALPGWLPRRLRGRLLLLMLVAALPALVILLNATFWLRGNAIAHGEAELLSLAGVLAVRYQDRIDEGRALLGVLAGAGEFASRQGCEAMRANVRGAPPLIANVAAIRPDGRVVCSARGDSERPISVADRPYFRRALLATGFAGGDYIVGRLTGKPLLVFTHTIRQHGEVDMVLALAFDLSWLQARQPFAGQASGAAYALYDRDGTLLIADPERAAVGREMSGTPLWAALAALPAAGTTHLAEGDGGDRLYGYVPLGPASAPYVHLAVDIPAEQVHAGAGQLLRFGLAGLALACIMGLAIGWVGARRLVLRPLQPIFDTVRRLAGGDLTARTGCGSGSGNELGALAGEVDRMASALASGERQRHLAEAALRCERDRAQAYLDVVGVMVIALDEFGKLTLVNRKACEVLGCDLAACRSGTRCLGENWFERHFAAADRLAEQAVFQRLMAGEIDALAYRENTLHNRQGEPRRVAWHNALLRDGEGRICGVLAAGQDITERWQLLDEHERLQRQLRQVQKMEALGQLTGGIAHDFNNILASVLGFSKLALLRHVPDPNSRLAEYLREVVAAGERARELVAKMLAFSRARSGGEAAALALAPLIDEGVKMLAPTIPASIRIACHFAEGVPEVAIAPVDFNQILMNLVINARDAMSGKGKIDIHLARVELVKAECAACHAVHSGSYVALSVADSGQGIAPDVLPRIFDPFFSTKEVGRGSGMGLAVVHGLVCHAGGLVEVESTPGQGSVVRVSLPLAARSAGGLAATPAPVESPDARPVGGRILVVDDEVAICRFLADLLSARGWSVQTFCDPGHALTVFREAPAAWVAVITDETMPDLCGVELVAGLRELRPDLPAILCTGYSERVDDRLVRQLGNCRLFQKPVDPAELLAALAGIGSAELFLAIDDR